MVQIFLGQRGQRAYRRNKFRETSKTSVSKSHPYLEFSTLLTLTPLTPLPVYFLFIFSQANLTSHMLYYLAALLATCTNSTRS